METVHVTNLIDITKWNPMIIYTENCHQGISGLLSDINFLFANFKALTYLFIPLQTTIL